MIRPALALLFIFGSVKALADTSSPIQNYQDLKGDCNLVINNPQGGDVQLPSTVFCSGIAASKSAADSLQKMARFIEASNPTEVKLSSVSLIKWAGDAERYLTLSLENPSNLPAEKVKIRILEKNANEGKLSFLSLTPSHAVSKRLLNTLAIPQRSSTKLPIGPESELVILTKRQVPVDYDFMGASLSPNIPDELKMDYLRNKGISSSYSLNIEVVSLAIELRYNTIFGGRNSSMSGLFLFYGHANTLSPLM